jgi:hypothetical protein
MLKTQLHELFYVEHLNNSDSNIFDFLNIYCYATGLSQAKVFNKVMCSPDGSIRSSVSVTVPLFYLAESLKNSCIENLLIRRISYGNSDYGISGLRFKLDAQYIQDSVYLASPKTAYNYGLNNKHSLDCYLLPNLEDGIVAVVPKLSFFGSIIYKSGQTGIYTFGECVVIKVFINQERIRREEAMEEYRRLFPLQSVMES